MSRVTPSGLSSTARLGAAERPEPPREHAIAVIAVTTQAARHAAARAITGWVTRARLTRSRSPKSPGIELPPVSEQPPAPVATLPSVPEMQRRVDDALGAIAEVTDELGARFAAAGEQIALVGGPVRDAMLGRLHHDLDFTTSARPEVTERLLKGWADATVGHGPGLRHDRRPQGRLPGRDHHLPLRGVRRVLPQAERGLRGHPRRRPRPARLHRQRDGGLAARQRRRGPLRRGGRPGPRAAAHAGPPGGLLLRRPAADDAGRPFRRPARLLRRPGRGRRDDGDGRAGSRSCRPSGSATSW